MWRTSRKHCMGKMEISIKTQKNLKETKRHSKQKSSITEMKNSLEVLSNRFERQKTESLNVTWDNTSQMQWCTCRSNCLGG
jgi:predicted RNA-binding protein with RPS1 domain